MTASQKITNLILAIDGIDIKQDEDGLYSINDLHKVSGGFDKHSPRRWMRLKRTQNLIAEINSESKTLTVKRSSKSGKNPGTFVCVELVYAYAMAISAKFELKVIRGFHAAVQKKDRLARLHGEAEWNQNRALGKYQRKNIADSIQQFIEYAKAQGSRGARHYFVNITKCVNKALCIHDRDEVDEDALHLLATAEVIAERVLLDGMRQQLPYKTIFQEMKLELDSFAKMVVEAELA